MGLALDPNFADTQWILSSVFAAAIFRTAYQPLHARDGKLDLESEKLLLKFEEQRKECCHHAGSLHFGPRGELFIATGDNTHPHGDSQGYAPIDERPDRAPWDAQKSSANTNSYNGKILRIRPTPEGGYEIPDGNLFPKDGSKGRPEIYAMGCRNPWRMTVDSKSGFVYWGEVGPDAKARTNVVPEATTKSIRLARQATLAGLISSPTTCRTQTTTLQRRRLDRCTTCLDRRMNLRTTPAKRFCRRRFRH